MYRGRDWNAWFCSKFLARFPTTWPVYMGILHQHIYITFCLQAIAYYFTTSTGISLDGHFINIYISMTSSPLRHAPSSTSLLIVAALFPSISHCGVMISRSSSDCTLNLSAVHPTAHFFQHFPPQLPLLRFLSASQCEFGFGRSQRPPYWITFWITTRNTPSFHFACCRNGAIEPGHMQVCSPSL